MIKPFLCGALLATAGIPCMADEGMWTLYNLPDAVYGVMRTEGLRLPKSALYDDSTALKNCVVNFSGYCTGEVISPNGLIITNHHCGFEAIRRLSTEEDNILINGFIADSTAADRYCENTFVAFMRDQRDVTPILDSLDIHGRSAAEQRMVIDSLTNELTQEAKRQNPDYYVEILPFYGGNAYYATTYIRYDDIRLVAAPPKCIGKFGGETDNWMWPRQTCDFSVFRIYAKADGTPAEYSTENVPLHCNAWIPVSVDGYKEGDFAMTVGFPGATSRYISSYGIEERRNGINEPTYIARGVKLEVMKRHMKKSMEVRLKYDGKYASCSNYWKNSIGMNKCIDSIGLIQQKRNLEKRIAETRHMDLRPLAALYARRAKAKRAFTLLNETMTTRSNSELATRAYKYFIGQPANPDEANLKKQYVEFNDNSDKWDADLDRELLAASMELYRREAPEKFLPAFYERVDKDFGGDCAKYVDAIWKTSVLMQNNRRIPLKLTRKLKKDLGIEFAMDLMETRADLRLILNETSDSVKTMERLLCAEKIRMEEDMPHYSDANFTMRMSYGQVGGFCLGDRNSGYYTTAPSIVEKMKKGDSNEDYRTTADLQQLFSVPTFDMYTDSVSGSLNLCFLTNNDITGGNSGSPVIDGSGRLIGLAFDGTWDSLSSDIFYDKTLARTICVDIRYILYVLQHWGKADALIQEMLGSSMPK